MKRYIKEIVVLLLQLLVFYVCPLFAGPADIMGLVVLIILITILLSVVLGFLSNSKIKYLYPIVIAVLFIPSVFIYYNESALIHSFWYLIASGIGLLVGVGVNMISRKLKLKK